MVLPQVKGLSAEIWDFSRGLGEIQPLENEVSHRYLGMDCRRSVMVLPQELHLAAERGHFGSVLGGNQAVEIELSHWCLGVFSRR
jgi:hypothetical protein